MVRCADGTLYTGSTNDVRRRLAAHNAGRGAKYLRGRLPVRVVFVKKCTSKSRSLREEAKIKALTRKQKMALIRTVKDLSGAGGGVASGLVGVFLICGLFFASTAWALPKTQAEIVDHDPLGVWRKSRSFERVRAQGAQTVFLPLENNFFAYWKPAHYRSGRIMVAVHGTGGNPYEELKDEIAMAEKFDYLVVAVNWFLPRKGFLTAGELYRQIQFALSFIQEVEGNDLQSVAYIGFSRGGAISYEVAYLDAKAERLFDLVIAHSGGIPKDFRVEAKNPESEADTFFRDLAQGGLGTDPLKGTRFFLYSGDQDESWGTRMSEQMAFAKSLIETNGGQVVEWVRRGDLGHSGLRQDRTINERAVRHFIELTT